MECHPWFEVSDRRKIRFRNVQIKVLLVFEQGRPLQVLTSFDKFWQVLTSFDKSRLVYKSFDTIQDTIVYGITQLWLSTFFRGGSLLLPTSLIMNSPSTYIFWFLDTARGKGQLIDSEELTRLWNYYEKRNATYGCNSNNHYIFSVDYLNFF